MVNKGCDCIFKFIPQWPSKGAPSCQMLSAKLAWHMITIPAAICWGALPHKLSMTDSGNVTKLNQQS